MNWIDKIIESSVRERGFVITASVILFLAGIWAYSELNIEAYPDPTPPLVEIIVQKPGWSALGEIYRYQLVGEGYTTMELKEAQDWILERQFRQVPGIIDVVGFGGPTKKYHFEINPARLIAFNFSISDVMDSIEMINSNVGGNYLNIGEQSYNVRGVGLFRGIDDIANVMVDERDGMPIYVHQLGEVVLNGVILVSFINNLRKEGRSLVDAVTKGSKLKLRAVMMIAMAAGIGLFPAAISTGIGSETQQPLAQVVVAGMVTAPLATLLVLPVMYLLVYNRNNST